MNPKNNIKIRKFKVSSLLKNKDLTFTHVEFNTINQYYSFRINSCEI